MGTKGELNGRCNMTACRSGNELRANWFNHSTKKHYCKACAKWLNSDTYNQKDAMEMYGHDLCTEVSKKIQVTAELTIHLVLELDGNKPVDSQLDYIKENILTDSCDVQVLIPSTKDIELIETKILDLEEVSRTDI